MKSKYVIPVLTVKDGLYKSLLLNSLFGFWNVLDVEGKSYFHLLCILIDKSIYEYDNLYHYLIKEIKTNDHLTYKLRIMWHLENCINAIARANKVLNIILNGIKTKKGIIKKDQKILKFIQDKIANNILSYNVTNIRNRIEHMEEDIFLGKIGGSLLANIDEEYKFIHISKEKLLLNDLVFLIDTFYSLVIGIQSKIPNRIEPDGVKGKKYYYPDGVVEYIKK